MATSPTYAATPVCGVKRVTTVSTDYSGTGDTVLIAGVNGARIDAIVMNQASSATNLTGFVCLWITRGSATVLLAQYGISNTISTQRWKLELNDQNSALFPLFLQAADILVANVSATATIDIAAIGGDF